MVNRKICGGMVVMIYNLIRGGALYRIISLFPERNNDHMPLDTWENPGIWVLLYSCDGKCHSHTIETLCQAPPLFGNNASPTRKFSGPCDLDL